MKKKLFILILSIISVVCLAIGLTACDNGGVIDNYGQDSEQTENDGGNTDEDIEDETSSLITYTLSDDGTYYSVTNCDDSATSIAISATYNELPVTNIGDFAFAYCSLLESITIPDSVTTIGNSAFLYCPSLESIIIPDSVTTIGEYAFASCYKLSTITIPQSVTSIGSMAFSGCTSLISISLPFVGSSAENAEYTNFGYIFGAASYIENWDWIPETLTTVEITNGSDIEEKAFYECTSLKNVIILGSLTTIGSSAFENCTSLEYITLPDSVTAIGSCAFSGCASLEYITLPDSVTTIGSSAFSSCNSLESIALPDSVMTIGEYAFYYCCKLLTLTIPQSVTSIGDYAFMGCERLVEVYNLSALKIIAGSRVQGYAGYYAKNVYTATEGKSHFFTQDNCLFIYDDDSNNYLVSYNGTDTDITLPVLANGFAINGYAFYCNTEITNVVIPDNVTAIGDYSFDGCTSLKEINIPDSVLTVGNYAFRNCTSATKLYIGCGIIDIGSSAFYNCTALTEIYYNVVTLDDLWRDNCIFYDVGKEGNGIKLTIGEKVKYIPSYLFCPYVLFSQIRCYLNITEIEFDNNCLCENIGENAFAGCRLNKITIPDSVISIGEYAFYECTALTAVNFTENSHLESIGNYAFYCCTALKEIDIPDGVSIISDGVFYSCHSLVSVSLPDGVLSIGDNAFNDCYSLESFIIPSSVTAIGAWAFYGCDSISITFENTSGWYVSASSSASSGIDVDVTDADKNATYFKDAYYNYYWYRCEE